MNHVIVSFIIIAQVHAVAADPHPGEDGGVVGDPHVVLEDGAKRGDVLLVDDRVGVAVDVGVVGDRDPVAQGDPAAVVEQHVAMDDHIVAHVEAPASGNPHFSGSYLMLSWTVTGESRRYNRATGTANGIIPEQHHGAVELVARYSRVDLQDAAIDGGLLDKIHVGVNWWASRQWKLGVSYGDADLDRDDIRGNTRMLLCRLQWFY